MKKLSKKEWVAVAVAVVFVGYTLFGGEVMSIFQRGAVSDNSIAGIAKTGISSGVVVNDIVVGQGSQVEVGQLVSVHYLLSLSDGTVIQNSKDFGAPLQFVLGAGQVIPGWEQGFDNINIGGIRTISIPPEFAYGAEQVGPIPPNSTLIFTVEVVDAVSLDTQ